MSTPAPLPPSTLLALGQATGLLTDIGRADPSTVSADVAVLCLAAAEELRPLGVEQRTARPPTEPIEATISAALALLAQLPASVFATTAILDAASHARLARELAS